MPVIPDWLIVVCLVYVISIFALFFLPFFMYFRVKGIERAMWAIVSQLRATRLEGHTDVDPAATRRAREVADQSAGVKMSMFGR